MQRPLGPKDMVCPLHNKYMVKVCHTCPLWVPVPFVNNATGEESSEWGCSLAWLPGLLIETAKEARQGAAATESFRNEMVRREPIQYVGIDSGSGTGEAPRRLT